MSFKTDTLRFESHTVRANDVSRYRCKSDGKIKTSLNVLAKARPVYEHGTVTGLVSDAKDFNNLTELLIHKNFVYTEYVLPVKELRRINLLAPAVPATVTNTIGQLLTALLAFKGKTLEVVRQHLKLCKQRGAKTLTYNVNTTVTWGEVQFKVGKVTVKKTYEDGIFFCGKTCFTVKNLIAGAIATKDGQVNVIE